MAKKETKKMMAILGFIFSIVFPLAGLVLSIIALHMIRKGEKYKGLATAGLIISIVLLVIPIILLLLGAIAFFGVLSTAGMSSIPV